MKIIEAMKRLGIIEKRIISQSDKISEYSSKSIVEEYILKTKDAQKKEIENLLKSNQDLAVEYLNLKRCIEYTNIMTKVDINSKSLSISELIILRRKMGDLLRRTFNSMNNSHAIKTASNLGVSQNEKNKVIEIVYDENIKVNHLRDLEDFIGQIDGRLEVVNATTDLLTPPE